MLGVLWKNIIWFWVGLQRNKCDGLNRQCGSCSCFKQEHHAALLNISCHDWIRIQACPFCSRLIAGVTQTRKANPRIPDPLRIGCPGFWVCRLRRKVSPSIKVTSEISLDRHPRGMRKQRVADFPRNGTTAMAAMVRVRKSLCWLASLHHCQTGAGADASATQRCAI